MELRSELSVLQVDWTFALLLNVVLVMLGWQQLHSVARHLSQSGLEKKKQVSQFDQLSLLQRTPTIHVLMMWVPEAYCYLSLMNYLLVEEKHWMLVLVTSALVATAFLLVSSENAAHWAG
jgi:hypothetical protein